MQERILREEICDPAVRGFFVWRKCGIILYQKQRAGFVLHEIPVQDRQAERKEQKMTEWETKRNVLLAQKVIKGLASRNMEGFYAATKEEALAKMLSLIPEGSSIGWGGTMSVGAIGGFDAIRNGSYKLLDRDAAATPEEKEVIQRQIFSADYFLTSSNAITEDGILVNIDGNSNRVSAIAFGPAHVIVVAGMNKIVKTEADARSRAKNIAAPINAQRFGLDTPCAKTGACFDCTSHDTVCCQELITRYSKHDGRIKVILVNEDLGF